MTHSKPPRHRARARVQQAITLELMEARRLLATITGSVFYDDNLDGVINAGEGGVAGWSVYADVNANGTFDGANSTYASNTPLAINDNATLTSSLPIAGNGGVVASVRVTINITHTYVADLDIFLISPTGTRVELTTDNGGGGDNFVGTTFDDNAATSITSIGTVGPFTGSYRPEGSLGSVVGQNIDGTWKLEIADDASQDIGTLNSWSLNFSSGEPSATTSTAGYTLLGIPAGTYNVYLTPQSGYQTQRDFASAVVASAGSTVSGVNFGVRQPPGSITGVVFADYNIDGIRDPDEIGIAGRTVYVDLDNDSQLDAGEPSTLTDSSGTYAFAGLRPGQRYIRTLLPTKWFQTSPSVGGLMGLSSLNANNAAAPSTPRMGYVQNQMILSVSDRSRLDGALGKLANRGLRNAVSMQGAGTLGNVGGESILFVNVRAGGDSSKIAEQFARLAGVRWAQPNYSYADGVDPREYTPNDPSYASQYHHTKMQNNLAWDVSEGAGVKIGITDDGFQLNHPDLVDNIYVNTAEIAGNGIDDDGNGYIDDRNGWDFTNSTTPGTGDNNPSPASSADNHGTHVTGIAAARSNNGTGVAGTAGKSTVVPLRFYSTTTAWTSTVIWNTYKYAVDNGIKIVSTSYNVDGFASDNLYLQAINYLYDNGVLHFNSAGNSSQLNPVRQKWDQSLYVVATTSTDAKASYSNYGTGVDISAPGDNIYSTSTNNAYVNMSGTSMATPNAAGVAALVWSAHPTWTRDQVAAQILGMADNIDSVAGNAAYANLLGTGRVNSYRSVTQTLGAPKLRNVLGLPDEGATTVISPTQIRVQFSNVLDAAAANNMANWKLIGAGPDAVFGNADDVTVPLSLTGNSTTYRIGTNEFLFNIGSLLTTGTYRFVALSGAGGLIDPFGTPLDGNGDGTGGDSFQREFIVTGITAAQNTDLVAGEDKLGINFGTRETIAPKVTASSFQFETGLALKFTFDEDMTTLDDSSVILVNTTTGQTLPGTAYDVSFDQATRVATVFIDHHIAGGDFVTTLVSDSTRDRFGNKLDGDSDGTAGGDYSHSFFFVQGDVNRDRMVDFDDLLSLAQNYGQSGRTFSQGNVNFDSIGNVDFDDLLVLAQQYGTTLARSRMVTETRATTRTRVAAGLV